MRVVDMHCDTLAALREAANKGVDMELRSNSLHLDLEKMKQGDYMLQNFAMFVFLGNEEDPLTTVMQLADIFYQEMEKNKDVIGIVRKYDDILENERQGKMSALLTVEEGGVCKGELAILRNLYRLGVRMMTLTWNFENELAYPNVMRSGQSPLNPLVPNTALGLKEKGFAFIEEMERLGMIIDVSHLSDKGFYDIYEHTTKPFVASHSNARALGSHCRNLTDDMIRKLAQRGGVTGLNYCPAFVMDAKDGEKEVCTVKRLAEHARYLANVGGIQCVGLGSDFDGIGGEVEMKNCSMLPLLEWELKKQGFHESEIEAIFHKNVLRVYKEILK